MNKKNLEKNFDSKIKECNLSDKQKEILTEIFNELSDKYLRMSKNSGNDFFLGVSDGFNSSQKVVNGIKDDYLAQDYK